MKDPVRAPIRASHHHANAPQHFIFSPHNILSSASSSLLRTLLVISLAHYCASYCASCRVWLPVHHTDWRTLTLEVCIETTPDYLPICAFEAGNSIPANKDRVPGQYGTGYGAPVTSMYGVLTILSRSRLQRLHEQRLRAFRCVHHYTQW